MVLVGVDFGRGSSFDPTLDELASHAGWSAFHTHRLFKAVTGVTPKAYAAAHRASRVRGELRARTTVTEAIYGAGPRTLATSVPWPI